MKAIVFAGAAAVLAGVSPSQASVMTLGSYAKSCYEAAESRVVRRDAFDACNNALGGAEALTLEDRVGTYVNRGVLRMISGDLARANQDFDQALALNPREPEAWLNKGIVHMQAGNSRLALSHVEKAIELRTRKPQIAYYVRALAYEDSGNLMAAYTDLKRAQNLAPKWRVPTVELARYQVRPR